MSVGERLRPSSRQGCAQGTPQLRRTVSPCGTGLRQERTVARTISLSRVCYLVQPGRPSRQGAVRVLQPRSTLGSIYETRTPDNRHGDVILFDPSDEEADRIVANKPHGAPSRAMIQSLLPVTSWLVFSPVSPRIGRSIEGGDTQAKQNHSTYPTTEKRSRPRQNVALYPNGWRSGVHPNHSSNSHRLVDSFQIASPILSLKFLHSSMGPSFPLANVFLTKRRSIKIDL
jgi:hypothetical protein